MNNVLHGFSVALLGGGLGGGEILLILAVALLLFDSKNLPKIARGLGNAMEEFRRASRQVTQELMREDPAPRPPAKPEPPTLPPDPHPPEPRKDA